MRFLVVISLVLLLGIGIGAVGTTLEIWVLMSTEQGRIMQDMIESELTPRTGISVNLTVVGWEDGWSKAMLAAASGEVPDIGHFGQEMLFDLAVRGVMLVDWEREFGDEYQEVRSWIFPGIQRSHSFRGVEFGLADWLSSTFGYYRVDILDRLGMEYPLTWEEVRLVQPRLLAQGMTMGSEASVALGPNWAGVTIMTYQHGGELLTPDLQGSALGGPLGVQAFRALMDLYTNYRFPPEIQGFNMFRNGDIPILIGHQITYSQLRYGAPELAGKWAMGLVPGTQRDGIIDHTAYLGGRSIGIFAQSKKKAEAWEYLKWWLHPDTQTRFVQRVMGEIENTVYFTYTREAFMKLDIPDDHRQVMFRQMDLNKAQLMAPGSLIGNRYLNNAAMEVLHGRKDAQTAITDAAHQVTEEIQRKYREFDRFLRGWSRDFTK